MESTTKGATVLKLTLSTYELNGKQVWQAFNGGSPLCREQDDRAVAQAVIDRVIGSHHGRVQVWVWNGDTCEEAFVFEGVGGSGSERFAA